MHFVSFHRGVNSDNKKQAACLTGVNYGLAACQFVLAKAGCGCFLGDVASFSARRGRMNGRIIPARRMDLYPFLE